MNVMVNRPMPIPVPPTVVTIKMHEHEARVLTEVLWHVGGGEQGPRGAMSELLNALHKADLVRLGDSSLLLAPSIVFHDFWPAGVKP